MSEHRSPRLQRCDGCGVQLPLAALRRFYPAESSRSGGRSLDVLCALRALASGSIVDNAANSTRLADLLARVLRGRALTPAEEGVANRVRPVVLRATTTLVALDVLGGRRE